MANILLKNSSKTRVPPLFFSVKRKEYKCGGEIDKKKNHGYPLPHISDSSGTASSIVATLRPSSFSRRLRSCFVTSRLGVIGVKGVKGI